MGVTFFEADALENPRAVVACKNEQQQDKGKSTEPPQELKHLLQLAVEEESRQDIHAGVKERAKSIYQQKAPWTDLDGSRAQGHQYP